MDLEFRPLTPPDFPNLVRWSTSAEFLLQWAGPGFGYPLSTEELEMHHSGCRASPPLREMWKAVDAGRSAMVGHGEIGSIDRTEGSATISRVIVGDPLSRGKGIGTAIMQFLLRRAFGELGLSSLDLYVFDFNQRAIDCYSRVGFRIDTRMANVRRVGDAYWSLYRMVMDRPRAP